MPTIFCACGERYQVADQHIGRRIKCGKCGRQFEVRPEPEARRAEPSRDPYRNTSSYRSEPARDPYRNDPYHREDARPSRDDRYRDEYRDRGRDGYRRDDEYYDDRPPGDEESAFQQMSGFFTPKVRLFLFIGFAVLALLSAALLLSTMKPAGNSLPASGVPEEGPGN
jgi:hypothetical protein